MTNCGYSAHYGDLRYRPNMLLPKLHITCAFLTITVAPMLRALLCAFLIKICITYYLPCRCHCYTLVMSFKTLTNALHGLDEDGPLKVSDRV